jgi:rhodanese-related sulfurtransferase
MKRKLKSFILSISLACLISSACSNREEPSVANQEFQFTNMKAVEAAKILKDNSSAVVLDIRTPAEFNEGHIPNAVNIDYKANSFDIELGKLDRDTTYVMHCRSGRRSANSFEIFKKLGFKNIIHMDDGILGWEEELVK